MWSCTSEVVSAAQSGHSTQHSELSTQNSYSRLDWILLSNLNRIALSPEETGVRMGAFFMTLVNSLCAEINIYQGVAEKTGVFVERRAIRGKKGLCKSMRDLAIKTRVLGDGVYYIPIDLWPNQSGPVVVHKHDWTVIGSIPRTTRTPKGKEAAE